MTEAEKQELLNSANHWETVAREDERMAAWDREHGIDLSQPGQSPGDYKARSARATAQSLRLEAWTGRPHCSCHLSLAELCPSAQRPRK